jgi:hypothetical protein
VASFPAVALNSFVGCSVADLLNSRLGRNKGLATKPWVASKKELAVKGPDAVIASLPVKAAEAGNAAV